MEKRPDSNTVLQHGTGTPYLAIFNSQNSVIRDPKNGLPLGTFVTDFQYVYEEEKTDHGQINIDTDNPDLISLNELGYQQGLILQWGYIYPDKTSYIGPTRKVVITGMKTGFTATGVHITLEFSDASTLLKNSPSQHYDFTKGFVKYVEDLCQGLPIGLAIIDYNSSQALVPKVAHRIVDADTVSEKFPRNHNVGTKIEWATESPFNALDPTEIIQPPTLDVPGVVGVEILDYNPITKKLTIKDPDNFRKVYLKEEVGSGALLVGTSRSKYYQLADIARGLSNGPYFMDSRDDQIIIHNQEIKRDIVKVYTYAGGYGELIEFTISSKFVKSSVEVKQSNQLDPDTKSLDTVMVQGVVDPDHGNSDGIDTYMVWPDRGTMFWNPGPGSVKNAPIEAANAPLMGQPSKPKGHLMEYRQRNNNQTPTVQADQEKPYKNYFSSISEAQKWFNSHPQVNQAEIDEWFTSWQRDFESKRSANNLESLARNLDRIPPFVIKRKVSLQAEINLENLGGTLNLKNRVLTDDQTETFKNAVLSGQIDLSRYSKEVYYRDSAVENAMIMRGTYIKNAEAMLMKGGFSVMEVSRNDGETEAQYKHRKTENRLVSIDTEIEIQLDGVDVAAGADSINIPGSLGNDIIQKVTDSVKAEATVIGDPVIESSMNIQIQNVSEKYSGLWYTKRVTHTINKSGYLTKIEFVQRTVPISQVTVKATLSKKDYAKQLQTAFKQAQESQSYKAPSRAEVEIKNKLGKPEYVSPYFHDAQVFNQPSVVTQVDPRNGKMKEARLDIVSGTYITVDRTIYDKGKAGSMIQDLQKQVDQLPRQ